MHVSLCAFFGIKLTDATACKISWILVSIPLRKGLVDFLKILVTDHGFSADNDFFFFRNGHWHAMDHRGIVGNIFSYNAVSSGHCTNKLSTNISHNNSQPIHLPGQNSGSSV